MPTTDNREHYRFQIANLSEEQRGEAISAIEIEYNLKAAYSVNKHLAKDSEGNKGLGALIVISLQEATKMREQYAKDPEEKKKEPTIVKDKIN